MILLFVFLVTSQASVNYTTANATFSWPGYRYLIESISNSTLQSYPAVPYQIV